MMAIAVTARPQTVDGDLEFFTIVKPIIYLRRQQKMK